MKYLVMECHPGYAVLLDEQGVFRKAANFHYTVGETVENPMLMQEPSAERTTAHRRRWVGSIAALAACLVLALGFGYYREYMTVYSSIFLSINPEVRMELNRHGDVVHLEGENDDGEALIEDYDCNGKDKLTVSDELIDRAIAMGFLQEGGQIAFSIDAPDENLFREYGRELRDEVNAHLKDKLTVAVLILDYHETGGEVPAAEKSESKEKSPQTEKKPKSSSKKESDYGNSDYKAPSSGSSGSAGAAGSSQNAGNSSSGSGNKKPASSVPSGSADIGASDYPSSSDYGDSSYEPGNSGYESGDSGYESGDSGYDDDDD